MSEVTKVDFDYLNSSGNDISDYSDELNSIITRIKELDTELFNNWFGIDSDAMKVKSDTFINNLELEYNYLCNWSNYFKKSALKYNTTFEENNNKINTINSELDRKDENE
jgi:hypothetical protein